MAQLYRHFDKDGNLLYVGISLSFTKRLAQHRDASHWFSEIASVTVEHFNSRDEARIAETNAIHNESPRYNLMRPTPDDVQRERVLMEEEERRMKRGSSRDLIRRLVSFNPMYSIKEVSEILLITKDSVSHLINSGKLHAVVIGSRRIAGGVETKTMRVSGWQLIDFIEALDAAGDISKL